MLKDLNLGLLYFQRFQLRLVAFLITFATENLFGKYFLLFRLSVKYFETQNDLKLPGAKVEIKQSFWDMF